MQHYDQNDTIETFKIISKIYDEETVPKLTPSSTEYTIREVISVNY